MFHIIYVVLIVSAAFNVLSCLFQVFGNAPPSTMMEKFSDLLQFTTQVSRLMVTEIRRRASNKSTGKPSSSCIM